MGQMGDSGVYQGILYPPILKETVYDTLTHPSPYDRTTHC